MAGENKQITTLIITYENGNQSLAQVDSDMHTILQTMLFNKKAFIAKTKKKNSIWKYIVVFFIVMMVLTLINQNKKSENANLTTIRNKKSLFNSYLLS